MSKEIKGDSSCKLVKYTTENFRKHASYLSVYTCITMMIKKIQ